MAAVRDTGVLICGHGSRDVGAMLEFNALVSAIAARLSSHQVASGFLEFAYPSIADGLQRLRLLGCDRICVVPGTLFSAGHAKRDIPAILNGFTAQNPDIQILYGRELGADINLARAATARVRDAVVAAGNVMAPEKTAVLVVARGASDPGAIACMETVIDALRQELNFGYAGAAYAGIASPGVPPALHQIVADGFQRIVVLPYFLFTGVLVNRVYQQTDEMALRHPRVQFLKASYLNNHPLIIACFVARILESIETGIRING